MCVRMLLVGALLALFATPFPVTAQPAYYSRAALAADLDSMYAVVRQVHPDMSAGVPRRMFERELDRTKASLPDSMHLAAFIIRVAPLLPLLNDGHTCFPAFHSIWICELCPLAVYVDPETMDATVVRDLSDTAQIPERAELLAINGHPIHELVADMLRYISGERRAFRISQLNQGLTFSHCLQKLHGWDCFDIRYRVGTDTVEVSLAAVPNGPALAARLPQTNRDPIRDFSLQVNDATRTALLEFNACTFGEDNYLNRFLDSAFTELKERGVTDLIIDIRRNGGGGTGPVDELFQYISPVPFRQFDKGIIKISDPLKAAYPALSAQRNGRHHARIRRLIPLRDNPLRFTGRMYLLTSSYTFSSAKDLAWAFRYFGMGTVIGEETGGTVVSFGNAYQFRMPNTRCVYSVSGKRFYGYGARNNGTRGVIPDIGVPAAQALDTALGLITQVQRQSVAD